MDLFVEASKRALEGLVLTDTDLSQSGITSSAGLPRVSSRGQLTNVPRSAGRSDRAPRGPRKHSRCPKGGQSRLQLGRSRLQPGRSRLQQADPTGICRSPPWSGGIRGSRWRHRPSTVAHSDDRQGMCHGARIALRGTAVPWVPVGRSRTAQSSVGWYVPRIKASSLANLRSSVIALPIPARRELGERESVLSSPAMTGPHEPATPTASPRLSARTRFRAHRPVRASPPLYTRAP